AVCPILPRRCATLVPTSATLWAIGRRSCVPVPGSTGPIRIVRWGRSVKSDEIRSRFLGHFEANGHTVVPSAPLPFQHPNLLFLNAGMVQFVPYFVGQQAAPFKRATSIQKCIRTLDIDEVGKTTRHGTFF